jgi:hypothetical protein
MSEQHTGAMVAFLPRNPEALTVPNGDPADQLHVTSIYLTGDHTELTAQHRHDIGQALAETVQGPIVATVTGMRALGSDDPPATVLMLDSPELHDLRRRFKDVMAAAGVPIPEDTYPEYLPHLTVGYGTPFEDAQHLVGTTFTIDRVAAFYGPDRAEVPLTKGTPVTRFYAPSIARMGIPTGDGRLILPGAISYRTLPISFRWQEFDAPGHDGAVVIGAVDRIEIDPETGNVAGYGELANPDVIPEVGRAMELMRLGVLGISIDPGQVTVEEGPMDMLLFSKYEISSFTALPIPAFSDTRVMLMDDMPMMPHECDDEMMPEDDWMSSLTAAVTSAGMTSLPVAGSDIAWDGAGAAKRVATWAGIDSADAGDAEWTKYGKAFLYRDDAADPHTRGAYKLGVADIRNGELMLIPRGVYAVAGVLSGARGGANIPSAQQDQLKGAVRSLYTHIADSLDDDSIKAPFSLTACATNRPPAAWFEDPKLTGPTPITITPDGYVYGHIGLHGQKHRGFSGDVYIPRSKSSYREFLLGGTMTAEGNVIPTGKITLGGGHASDSLAARPAAEHYDDVSTTVAVVSAGDDQFGVWVAGALKDGVSDEQIDELLQSPPSGDWRADQLGNLELIGVHSVNVPGFAVYRVNTDAATGRVYSLVASADFAAAKPAYALDVQGDLRAQLAAADVPWPTISMTVGGIKFGPYEVSAGCVEGMIRQSFGDTPAETDRSAMRTRAAWAKAQLDMFNAGINPATVGR